MNTFVFREPTDKMPGQWHAHYALAYSMLLSHLRGTTDAVLEIGTAGGGSLIAYHDWFENARIIGMDPFFAPEVLKGYPRIHHFKQDAYAVQSVDMLVPMGPFAVAVDDGPHSLESQLFFARNYPRLLSRDGIAIIEDIQSPDHIKPIFEAMPHGFTGYAIDMRLADRRYDSLIFCIERA